MSVSNKHPYISKDKKPVITATRTRVATIVAYYKLGYSPEELAREFPHLTLYHIYGVLSFYHEDKSRIDREIEHEKEGRLMNKGR